MRNAVQATDFYKKAFDAEERFHMQGPDAKSIIHAELKIGDSIFMLTEESAEMKSPKSVGGSPVSMYVYVRDVDAIFNQAVSAGATELKPVKDQFYGDRSGYLLRSIWTFVVHIDSQEGSFTR